MKSKLKQGLAILVILEIGLVHYFSAQHEFEESTLLGFLFIANFLGSLVAAYGIYRRKLWGWGLGSFIALGSLTAYVWSRTTGLPGLEPEEWLSPWGVMSLVSEGLFLAMVTWRFLDTRPTGENSPLPTSSLGRAWLPVSGLVLLIVVNFTTVRLDALFPSADHEHNYTLFGVRWMEPVKSLKAFEEEYGVKVSLVAVSSMDSIIDVRLKVLDLKKAQPLLDNHTALLVNDQTLILSPHQHRQPVKEGKVFFTFYPNQKLIVKRGTLVSLVFEDFRLEPIAVQ
jgi:hypothetical protein